MEDPDPALIWTMTHLSVVSAPVFRSTQGMPFGLQIAARRYNDYLLFNFIKYLLDMKKLPERSNPVWRERT
jgi:Asp-tRNA(Asn)/Glu-tRNA(Gln) amidotransferase A subunit family amidase